MSTNMMYDWQEIEHLVTQLRGTNSQFGETLTPLRSANEVYAVNVPDFQAAATKFEEALSSLAKVEASVQTSIDQINNQIAMLQQSASGLMATAFEGTLGTWRGNVQQMEAQFGQTKHTTDTLHNELLDLLKRSSEVHQNLEALQGQLTAAQHGLGADIDAFNRGADAIHNQDVAGARAVPGAHN